MLKQSRRYNRFEGVTAYGIACLAGFITLLVFIRSVFNGFVNIDDPDYVLNNPLIMALDWDHILVAFSTPHAGFWMPLTWISLAIDYRFWGLNPAGYHLTNVLLHSINTGLVVLVTDRLFMGQRGEGKIQGAYQYPAVLLLAGLLWGIHPLRVESVAWVTERKDVLNGLLFLGSLFCYLRFAHQSKIPDYHNWLKRDYLLSLVLFMLSLLAKPISVILPFVLLVVDWYPLCRMNTSNLRTAIVEKIPFLIFSAGMVLATLGIARHSDILASYDNLSALQRLVISGNAIYEYCRYMIYPAGILPLHVIDSSQMAVYGLKGMLFIALASVWVYVLRYRCWPLAALLCFLLPLLPVLAIFQNGIQAFASRFTYLPSLAPTVAIAFYVGSITRMKSGKRPGITRKTMLVAGVALIVAYGITTWRFIGIWKSTETVWSRIIDLHPTGRAFKERGLYYLSTAQDANAEHDLSSSIRFAQRANLDEIYKLYALRGMALRNQERYSEAKEDFDRAIIRCPDPRYFYHRGRTLAAMGKINEAEADFLRAGTAVGPIEWGNSVCR